MGVVDALRAAGYKPTANEDGQFKPLKGTYAAHYAVLRPETDDKGAKFYQIELKPDEVIDGDEFSEKFTFRKRVYLDGPKATENVKAMLDDLFTCGVELDLSSDEAMEADFEKAIGVTAYVRAWGWTPEKDAKGNALPESERRSIQQFVIQQKSAADKKRSATSHKF